MGKKGDKLSQESVISAEVLVAQIEPIEGITSKKMFGGHGIFHDGKMFGIIDSKGKAFFKIDDTTKGQYEEKGAAKHSRMPYYSIPQEILDNQTMLMEWAQTAIQISK